MRGSNVFLALLRILLIILIPDPVDDGVPLDVAR